VVTHQIETHLLANMNLSKKDIMISNFLGGLAWGLGTVVGATIVAAILIYSLKAIGVFEPLKGFFQDSPVIKQSQEITK
jgi:hypothetical protein